MLTISLYAAWLCKYLLYLWTVIFYRLTGHLLARLAPHNHPPFLLLSGGAVVASLGGIYAATMITLNPVLIIFLSILMCLMLTYICRQSIQSPIPYSVFATLWPIALSGSVCIGMAVVAHDNLLWHAITKAIKTPAAQIKGTIIDKTPEYKTTQYRIHIETICQGNTTIRIPGSYTIALGSSNYKQYNVGDDITVTITPKPTNAAIVTLPESSSFSDYSRKEQIVCHLRTPHDAQILASEPPTFSLLAKFWHIRRHLCRSLQKQLSPATWTFVRLIFLGDTQMRTSASLGKIRQHCAHWGLSHYLARSGLHLALLMSMWSFLLSFIPLHRLYKHGIRLILCALFWLFSWSSTPFIRTLIVASGIEIGILNHAPIHALHLIGHVAWLLLCISPLLIRSIDFQLTFALSASLCLLCTKTTK